MVRGVISGLSLILILNVLFPSGVPPLSLTGDRMASSLSILQSLFVLAVTTTLASVAGIGLPESGVEFTKSQYDGSSLGSLYTNVACFLTLPAVNVTKEVKFIFGGPAVAQLKTTSPGFVKNLGIFALSILVDTEISV